MRLVRLLLGESCALVGVGLVARLATAAAAARSISHMLFGLVPLDPVSFAAASAALITVAVVAAWIPARHAARIDPIVALPDP